MRVPVLPSFGCLKPGQKNRGHPLSQVRDRPGTRQARRERILSPASRPAGSCRVCRCRSRQLSVGLVTAFQASISCRGRRIRSDASPGTSLPSGEPRKRSFGFDQCRYGCRRGAVARQGRKDGCLSSKPRPTRIWSQVADRSLGSIAGLWPGKAVSVANDGRLGTFP